MRQNFHIQTRVRSSGNACPCHIWKQSETNYGHESVNGASLSCRPPNQTPYRPTACSGDNNTPQPSKAAGKNAQVGQSNDERTIVLIYHYNFIIFKWALLDGVKSVSVRPGVGQGWDLNIKMVCYQYMDFHDRDKAVSLSSYLHNGNAHVRKDFLNSAWKKQGPDLCPKQAAEGSYGL